MTTSPRESVMAASRTEAAGRGRVPAGHLPVAPIADDNPWEEIVRSLRTAEDGRLVATDVELQPGGKLILTGRGRAPQPLSQLPRGRMAA
jgi:hypothetical protein